MTISVSRKEFERRTAEILDAARASGDLIAVTDNGRTVFEIKPSAVTGRDERRQRDADILEKLRGSVLRYDNPFEPVGVEDWEALK